MFRFFNTATHKIEDFKSVKPDEVSIYSCGPTVYHFAHIGNLRSMVLADFLRRVSEYRGFVVNHIINITDVGHLTEEDLSGEDKIERAALKENKTVWQVAEYYTSQFLKDFESIGNKEPTKWVKATDHITEMIDFIRQLENKGYTYLTSDGVYFDTSKLVNYYEFVGISSADRREGERVEKNPEKINPSDFALWKFSPKDQKRTMEWRSPWGIGFPGWHIECSAMSSKYLGENFDIHTGGIDLIFPHHINEVAQSRGVSGEMPANYWIHGEFVLVDGKKMSKSLGNAYTLNNLKDRGLDPIVYRFLILQNHYRKPLNFTWESIEAARKAVENLLEIVQNLPKKIGKVPREYEDKFISFIENDLALPQALALFWDALKDKNLKSQEKSAIVKNWDLVLGLNLVAQLGFNDSIPKDILEMAQQRQQVRTDKDFDKADQLRVRIENAGYNIKDTAEGFILSRIDKTTKIN